MSNLMGGKAANVQGHTHVHAAAQHGATCVALNHSGAITMIDINTVTTTDLINLAQDTQRIIVTNKGIAKTANEANISHTATLARELLAACHIGCIDTVLVSLGKVEPKSTDDYRKISPIVSMVVDVYKALKAGTAIRVPAKVTWLVGGEVVKVVRLENVPSLINPNGSSCVPATVQTILFYPMSTCARWNSPVAPTLQPAGAPIF